LIASFTACSFVAFLRVRKGGFTPPPSHVVCFLSRRAAHFISAVAFLLIPPLTALLIILYERDSQLDAPSLRVVALTAAAIPAVFVFISAMTLYSRNKQRDEDRFLFLAAPYAVATIALAGVVVAGVSASKGEGAYLALGAAAGGFGAATLGFILWRRKRVGFERLLDEK
jgi:O-antigen/teichoic acid export membrane protein